MLYMLLMLIFLTFDNGDTKSSKRHVTFLSLIFLLKCVSKSILIKNFNNKINQTCISLWSGE